jgi:ribose-phosphate pyrophosphokinase
MRTLDLIDPSKSHVRYNLSSFPDGQPHFALVDPHDLPNDEDLDVLCSIKSPADIATLGMAIDVVLASALAFDRISTSISVHIAYMLGARMDRRISPSQPFTLEVLATMTRGAFHGADRVRVLDPHSSATLELLGGAEAIHPDRLVTAAIRHFNPGTIVVPDEGAVRRTLQAIGRIGISLPVAMCEKKRDPETGNLSGFALVSGDVAGRDCLIVDDLCDGGGTFAGISAVLRERGARRVGLCVTHGIFSKGYPIHGIDASYCTDSFHLTST